MTKGMGNLLFWIVEDFKPFCLQISKSPVWFPIFPVFQRESLWYWKKDMDFQGLFLNNGNDFLANFSSERKSTWSVTQWFIFWEVIVKLFLCIQNSFKDKRWKICNGKVNWVIIQIMKNMFQNIIFLCFLFLKYVMVRLIG